MVGQPRGKGSCCIGCVSCSLLPRNLSNMNQRQGRGMGWLHCFVGPDWTLSTTARPLDAVRGRHAETVIMRASEGRKNAIKPMSMSNPPMFQCCHILTKVRTERLMQEGSSSISSPNWKYRTTHRGELSRLPKRVSETFPYLWPSSMFSLLFCQLVGAHGRPEPATRRACR